MITVDYYETMKSTHWDPKFKELSCRLTKELVRVNYSRTGMAADLWPLATLSRLRPLTSESLFPSSATALLDALGLKEKDMLGTLITSDIPSWDVQCRTVLMLLKQQTINNPMIPLIQSMLGTPFRPREPDLMHNPNQIINIRAQTIHNPLRLNEQTNIFPPGSMFPISVGDNEPGCLNPVIKVPPFNSALVLPNTTNSCELPWNENVNNNLPFGIEMAALQQLLLGTSQSVYSLEQQQHRQVSTETNFTPHPPPVSPILTAGALGIPSTTFNWPIPSEFYGPPLLLQPLINHNLEFTNPCCVPSSFSHLPWWQVFSQLLREANNDKIIFSPQHATGRDLFGSVCKFDVLWSRDEVKTRFMCTACGRQWTSMKGSVAFVVILNYHRTGPVQVDRWLIQPGANVFFELFSQSCGECDVLCQPKWYPEEVSKVIRNLFVKIHENFYQSVIGWSDRWDCHRRDGHPSGPHDARKCVACQQGLCRGGLVISHAHAAKPASMFRVFPVYCPAQSTTVNVTNPATSPGLMVDSAQNSGRPHIRDSPTNSPSCKRRQTGSEFLTVS